MNEDNKTRLPGLIRLIPVEDKFFWLLLILFAGIPLYYFSYIPIWDGWQFSRCYMKAATQETLDCYRHSAFLHTFLYSLTQSIDLGNFQLIYAMNLLLGILGLVSFRSLVQQLFGSRLSAANLTLLTFCFGLNPVFLVHVIQPSLDFTLPIYLIMLLLCLFKRRFILASIVGVLLVYTKESGFMLYGVSVFLFIPLMLFNDHTLLKNKIELVRKIGSLIIPIPLFVLYMVIVPHTQIGHSWTEGIMKMFRFYMLSDVMLAQLISLFVINFNWIISAIILINAAVVAAQYIRFSAHKAVIKSVFNNRYEGIYFSVLFVAIVYFLTRIPFVNNPRYMLPALPVMIILFGGSLINVLRRQSLITVTLTIVLILLTVSSFRTVDPVSKKAMGTFEFGSHEMLQMARFDEPRYGYGIDQLAYNFEFTQLHYLTEEIFRKVGWARTFVIAHGASWLPDLGAFDIRTGHRAIYGEGLRSLLFIFPEQIKEDDPPQEIYYISYPYFDKDNANAVEREKLLYMYDLKEIVTVGNDGYSIDVYRYVKKND